MKSALNESDTIDVRRVINAVSLSDLCESAEQFFSRLDNWDYLHAKPLAIPTEAPELLIGFAHVVQGLKLLPDMTILDFGAGACWTSRYLSQLGLKVIASDVSPTALRIGKALYERLPLVGDQPQATFLPFDGHGFDLPDESVDRISCWDAFHHVANQAEVLLEMGRILKPGGIAGFSEPGPEHSKSPQSQYEMRTNRVIENDIDMSEIWSAAEKAGFTQLKLALFNPTPTLLDLNDFDAILQGKNSGEQFLRDTCEQMHNRRLFFLFKGDSGGPVDSRQRAGLFCDLEVEMSSSTIKAGEFLELHVVARNTGENRWLPATTRVGGVRFGIHLFDSDGVLLNLDYFRNNLTTDDERTILLGEVVRFDSRVPMPKPGRYVFQCDLVSEGVCWFEHNGARTVKLTVNVI